MSKKEKVLSDDEISVLKKARKILKKLSRKHNRLDDAIFHEDDEDIADKKTVELNEWEDELYREAKVDFLDCAFIDCESEK